MGPAAAYFLLQNGLLLPMKALDWKTVRHHLASGVLLLIYFPRFNFKKLMALNQWGVLNFFLMQTIKQSALDLVNGQCILALHLVPDSVGQARVTWL